VSLSPSTTRPFDAPEFILTLRCRHPARGHCFCPRAYSLNPRFWPILGTLQHSVTVVLQFLLARGKRNTWLCENERFVGQHTFGLRVVYQR
jgi:hypothetical protein